MYKTKTIMFYRASTVTGYMHVKLLEAEASNVNQRGKVVKTPCTI